MLYLRNLAMRKAMHLAVEKERSSDEKRVLHYMLDEHSSNVTDISKSLNLREQTVHKILADLRVGISGSGGLHWSEFHQ